MKKLSLVLASPLVTAMTSFFIIGTCEDDVKYAASCPGWANSGGCTKNRVSKVMVHYETLLTQSRYNK